MWLGLGTGMVARRRSEIIGHFSRRSSRRTGWTARVTGEWFVGRGV